MNRAAQLDQWLKNKFPEGDYQLEPMTPDASFRRYYRLRFAHTTHDLKYVVMDAPPEKENCLPFVAIANALRELNLQTPKIIYSDLALGFLVLSDFGDKLLLKELHSDNAKDLYLLSLHALSKIQACEHIPGWEVPKFSFDFMVKEFSWFEEWFVGKFLQINNSGLSGAYDFVVKNCASQPYVFMHRDYHSANLMLLPDYQIGILDFQDAFFGPVTYDLASLLRDCYIAWPEQLITELALIYKDLLSLKVSNEEFLFWFDMMSIQRHLKALMTFSRKWVRDKTPLYLQHIPRTIQYLSHVSQKYTQTKPISDFFSKAALPCVQ